MWRFSIKTTYYAQIQDEIQELTISELHNLVDQKVLFGNSYVFDTNTNQWVELNELSLFKKFDINFPKTDKNFEKPTRNPSQARRDYTVNNGMKILEESFLQDYVTMFQKQFDHLLEKNLELVNENIQLKIDKNELVSKSEIFKIEAKANQEKLEKEKYLTELKLVDVQDYNNDLIEEARILRHDKSELNKEVNSKLAHYTKENKQLLSSLELKDKKIEQLQEEIENLVSDLKITAEEIETLKAKNAKLIESHNRYEDQILEKIEKVKQSHDEEVQKLMAQINILSSNTDEKLRASQLHVKEQFSTVIAKKNEKINELLKQNEHIKLRYQEENQTAKQTFAKYQETLEQEKNKVKELNVVILEERKKAQELEQLLREQKQVEQKIPVKNKKGPVKRKQKVVGKLFELNNDPIWEIKELNDQVPYTFLEVKDMLLSKKINENSFVRKENNWWKKVKDFTEFRIDFFKKEEDGKIKLFVARESFRVPVFIPLSFNTMKADFIGKCLNLSVGGCFIEVENFSIYDLKQNDEINIDFEGDVFPEGFALKALIKEVVANDHGVGVQFIDMDDEQKQTIENYINHFLDELDQAA